MKRSPLRKRRLGPPRRGPANIPANEWRNPKYLRFLRERGYCSACFPWCLTIADPSQSPRVNRALEQCDPAHGPVNGMGSKGPDSGAIPLCRGHHDDQHHVGWQRFQALYRFSREEVAAAWWKAYLRVTATSPHPTGPARD